MLLDSNNNNAIMLDVSFYFLKTQRNQDSSLWENNPTSFILEKGKSDLFFFLKEEKKVLI